MLDLYPNNSLSSPLFFSDDEKELLTGSPILDMMKDEYESNIYDFGVLQRQVPGFNESINFDEYLKM